MAEYCKLCEKGFITKSEIFRNPEGTGSVALEWCSNALCDYNVRKKI